MAKFLKTLVAVAMSGGALLGANDALASSGTFAFNQTNTNSDQSAYATTTFTANVGDVIRISTSSTGTCALPGVTGTGDTYLRLFSPSGADISDDDDASCGGLQSFVQFTATASGTYSAHTGCYSSGSCSGTGAYSVTPAAPAAVHGVVFIHGTGDYQGTMSCTGSGSSTACTVAAAVSGYWKQGEIDSVRNGRAYAVVGFRGGTCAPWASGGEYGLTDPNGTLGTCGNPSGQGNADIIAAQIQQFITAGGITDLAIVTHSGGSNQARYILQNYTKSTAFTAVKNATRRVITIAAPTLGTYLADKATGGGVTGWIGDIAGYGGEGVGFIRTTSMTTYNGSSSYFGGINNPVSGVNFYSTGGVSGSTCYGVKVFGACVGITGPTLGGSSCDSLVDDVGLLALHTLYLNTNDTGTARNSCSDGFISCMSSQRLGNTFNYAQAQDHNQSRRQCNGLDVDIRTMVNGSAAGFSFNEYTSAQAAPKQLDACQYSVPGEYGNDLGYQSGCGKTDLGDGYCDWDCVAVYGHDAAATWDSTGTKVIGWGATDDCSSHSTGGDIGVYAWTSAPFNGRTGTNAGDTTNTWFTDPFAGTGSAITQCPQSLINDGVCDECALALYGNDGNDCLPGKVSKCGPLMAYYPAYEYTSTPISNNGYLTYSSGGTPTLHPYVFTSITGSGLVGDGICEIGECTASVTYTGTNNCVTSADCASGSSCVAGGCTTSGTDCSVTYPVPARTCGSNADCTGNACQASTGTCLLTGEACSSDASCSVPSGSTSTCSSGTCGCTTNNDCSGGATCTGGACSLTVTSSLCR